MSDLIWVQTVCKAISRRPMSPLARKYSILVYPYIFHLSANCAPGCLIALWCKFTPLVLFETVADPDEIQGVRSNPSPPLFKYFIKMK